MRPNASLVKPLDPQLLHPLTRGLKRWKVAGLGVRGELGMCYSVGIDAFRKMLVS